MDQTSSGLDRGCTLTDKDNALSLVEHDINFGIECIYEMYEDGKSVSFIAAEIGKSEAYVYTKMRQVPQKYEDAKRIRQENENIRLRRVRSLADMTNERYMEEMWADSERAADNIDRIGKIGKEYDRRIQLMEEKATENTGVGGSGRRPFNVVFRKTYETKEEADADEQAEYESADGADDMD